MFVLMRSLWSSIRALLQGKRFQERLDDEPGRHLEFIEEEYIKEGLAPEEAWRKAPMAFGGFDQIRKDDRQARGFPWLEDFFRDLRYGWRQLSRSPGFSVVSILILALGIGANTAIFSLINAVFIRALPVDVMQPARLVWIFTQKQKSSDLAWLSYDDFENCRKDLRNFSGLTAFEPMVQFSLEQKSRSERTWGALVSANFFSVMGVHLPLGRPFSAAEDVIDAAPAVVISHRLWQRFGGNSDVIGSVIRLNRHAYTIVGVAPERFTSPLSSMFFDVYVPLGMRAKVFAGSSLHDRSMSLEVLGRLSSGITIEQAQSELYARIRAIEPELSGMNNGRRPILFSAAKGNPKLIPEGLAVGISALLMAIAFIVLLTACTNVANLLKARAAARQQEIMMRVALGATRSRILRQLLTESLLLALVGSAFGLLLGSWVLNLFHGIQLPVNFPIGVDLGLNGTVFGFTAGAALISWMLFGLFPALYSSRPDILSSIKGIDDIKSRARFAPRRMRMLPQIAMSCLLLVVGGSLLKGMQHARSIHPGFDAANCLVVPFDTKLQGYSPVQARIFYERLQERLRALPDVRSVSRVRNLPLGVTRFHDPALIPGYENTADSKTELDLNFVGQGYFGTMSIQIMAGRDFNPGEIQEKAQVAVINETMAHRFWPNRDPLNRYIQVNDLSCRIIGVVKDSCYYSLGEAPIPFAYLPLPADTTEETTLCIKTSGNPKAVLPALRRQVQSLDSNMPIYEAKTMAEHVSFSLGLSKGGSVAAIAYGLLGLALASVGIYGVVSYSVRQRTREIGIRLALGENRPQIIRRLLIASMKPTAIGIVIGLIAASAVGKFLASALNGIAVADPAVYAAAAATSFFSSMIACYLPARRASRLDPMSALRCE